jgi:glycosyltransferase involved in cell wall biosynthesis
MKILQLTKKFPFPLKDGESIAVTNLSESLNTLGWEITLLSMNTVKHYISEDSIPDSYNHYKAIHTVNLDNRVTILGALENLFSKESYHICRFYFSEYEQKLVDLLKANEYDFIQLETLYLAPYIECIRSHSDAKIIMRSHNVEFEIWNRITSNTSFWPKKFYLNYLAKKLRKFEIESLEKYDALVTVTQRDLETYQKLGFSGRGMTLPIGLNSEDYIPEKSKEFSNSISFIGSLDWLPNLEGLNWFLDEVWPKIIQKNANLKLYIAGRNTPDRIKLLQSKNIIIEGEVDDAKAFINNHSIMIVPLLSGSGMRVKILEGMALNRVVISTSIGMEGIEATNKKEIVTADSPQEFVEMIDWVSKDLSKQEEIGNNARNFIVNYFDRETNTKKLINFLKS